jgi:Rrf2 family protein
MLKLTKKADYGLIALKHLALRADSAAASAKDIADTYGIPVTLLSKILQKLARNGFLRSEQGTHGGYRLARDPKNISALEVIRSIDGPIILTACFTEHGECTHSKKCNVREPLRRVHEGILRLLGNITIGDICRDDLEFCADDPAPPPHVLYELKPGIPASASAVETSKVREERI